MGLDSLLSGMYIFLDLCHNVVGNFVIVFPVMQENETQGDTVVSFPHQNWNSGLFLG